MEIEVLPSGHLRWQGREVRCALGRSGVAADKREGDGKTPAGRFPLRSVMVRGDRLAPPASRLPCRSIRTDDGWCDDPADPNYNRLVRLPYPGRHERLWRDDHVYDLVVPIGYNDDPVRAGRGSAIFLHVARPDYAPTEGCVALALDDLRELLAACAPGDAVVICAWE